VSDDVTVNNGESTDRSANGRFAAGNPGRKPGSKNRAAALADAIDAEDVKIIVAKAVDAAKKGERWAVETVLQYLYPMPKERTVSFDLPPIQTPEDIPAALDSVLQACSRGELTPAEAGSLCGPDCGQQREGAARRRRVPQHRPQARRSQRQGRRDEAESAIPAQGCRLHKGCRVMAGRYQGLSDAFVERLDAATAILAGDTWQPVDMSFLDNLRAVLEAVRHGRPYSTREPNAYDPEPPPPDTEPEDPTSGSALFTRQLEQMRRSMAAADDLPDFDAMRRDTVKAIEAERRQAERRERQRAKRQRRAERRAPESKGLIEPAG
jgi:hypothetical protein